ncbi:hypothetical protein J6590_103469, partial [Homalodisca vitripennis]
QTSEHRPTERKAIRGFSTIHPGITTILCYPTPIRSYFLNSVILCAFIHSQRLRFCVHPFSTS